MLYVQPISLWSLELFVFWPCSKIMISSLPLESVVAELASLNLSMKCNGRIVNGHGFLENWLQPLYFKDCRILCTEKKNFALDF